MFIIENARFFKEKEKMNLKKAIEKTRARLIKKVERDGLYENFGQKEVMKLKDEYIDGSSFTDEMNNKRKLLQDFDNWSMTYNGRKK